MLAHIVNTPHIHTMDSTLVVILICAIVGATAIVALWRGGK